MIKRKQHLLTTGTNGDSVQRQHNVPVDIYKFAKRLQIDDPGSPTLPDVYCKLIEEGLELVNTGKVVPVFTEIGRPDESKVVQIKFSPELNTSIVELKKMADKGEFEVITNRVAFRKHAYTKISLISMAVTLMEIGMNHRPHSAVG